MPAVSPALPEGPPASLDDTRWMAVLARDSGFDDRFCYAVETTGIYCRPSCPSRRPKRSHVRFYPTAAEARSAGFRPCKRCKPDGPPVAEARAAMVAKACRLIETAEEPPTLNALAAAAGMSAYHFHRTFKTALGVTPKAYATAYRNKRLRAALGRSSTVTEAVYDAGFSTSGRFYAASGEALGMTPRQFHSGGKDVAINFAIRDSSLGLVLVAATPIGVCAILFGDEPESLRRELEKQFPHATLIGGDDTFDDSAAKVISFVETPATGLDLPLDIKGTAFQHRVWDALRRIPAGSTASYGEIARAIGSPKAVRAVARACASNRIAVAIPCHRVVGSDGSLTGYRGGIERKRALLAKEAKR